MYQMCKINENLSPTFLLRPQTLHVEISSYSREWHRRSSCGSSTRLSSPLVTPNKNKNSWGGKQSARNPRSFRELRTIITDGVNALLTLIFAIRGAEKMPSSVRPAAARSAVFRKMSAYTRMHIEMVKGG